MPLLKSSKSNPGAKRQPASATANAGKPGLFQRLRPRVPAVWRERFDTFWTARNPREQAILGGGAVMLGLVIGYSVLWEPAATGGARLTRNMPALRADLAQMETEAQEARGLAASPAPALRGDALVQALNDSLGQQGLKATRVTPTGDAGVQVELEKVPFGAVASWLQDLQRQQRLKVTDARVIYVGATALVNASATLQGPAR